MNKVNNNKKRVVLVFPSFGNSQLKFNGQPPLGVLTVAAPLVNSGINVTILDECVEDNFDEKLLSELKNDPICIGISSMSGRHIKYALRISKLIKENTKIPVVWGGIHASLEPHSTIKHELVDIIVRDDGEETFPKLLDCLTNNGDLSTVKGIAYKNNGKVVFNDLSEPADIEKLPPMPFHLIDIKNYIVGNRDYWVSEPRYLIPIETSRGCPFSCIFCTESVRKKKWRALPPERVIEDIKYYIKKYGTKNFMFIDDNMFGDIGRGEKIIDLLVKEKLGINWYTNIRTDYMAKASTSFLNMLEQSGCKMLTFGAESGSKRILKMINKAATIEQVIETNKKLAKFSIAPHYVTIRGFPTETKEDIKLTYLLNIKLLLGNKKALCDSPFLITTPGSKIAEICLGEQTKNYTLEDWSQIFDFGKNEKPSWVTDEVYEFVDKHRAFLSLVGSANNSNYFVNLIIRNILKLYYFSLKYGFSGKYDLFINSMIKTMLRLRKSG